MSGMYGGEIKGQPPFAIIPKGCPKIARRFIAGYGAQNRESREGRLKARKPYVSRSFGTWNRAHADPALKRRAIVGRRFATTVVLQDELVLRRRLDIGGPKI